MDNEDVGTKVRNINKLSIVGYQQPEISAKTEKRRLSGKEPKTKAPFPPRNLFSWVK